MANLAVLAHGSFDGALETGEVLEEASSISEVNPNGQRSDEEVSVQVFSPV